MHVSQHVLGSGAERGTWLIDLQRDASVKDPLLLCTQSAMPWFFQAWLHTLQISVDGTAVPLKEVRRPALAVDCVHPETEFNTSVKTDTEFNTSVH